MDDKQGGKGPHLKNRRARQARCYQARLQVFRELVYVLMSKLRKKNGAIEFLSIRGFF